MEKQVKGIGEMLEQIISFNVGKEEYGVEIQTVKEVIRLREITRLPKAPTFVKGVINLRGDVIPIIDLREKFSLEEEDYTEKTRVIVVEVEGKSIGMVVDSVSHVARLAEDQIEPPPSLVGGLSGEYIRGVGKLGERLIVLLNIDRILSTEEKIELKNLEKDALAA
jgi:purine-binding chemotaxis protein CheW